MHVREQRSGGRHSGGGRTATDSLTVSYFGEPINGSDPPCSGAETSHEMRLELFHYRVRVNYYYYSVISNIGELQRYSCERASSMLGDGRNVLRPGI